MNPRSTSRTKPQSLRVRMKEEARAAILDAAEQVLSEQGLHATRMDDIAAQVGVSVGTLYNYFEDRQQLLLALLEVRARDLLALLDAELEQSQGSPYRARLYGFLRCVLEHSQSHFRLFSVLLEEGPRHSRPKDEPAQRRYQQELARELLRRVELLCEDGLRQGALRPEDVRHYPMLLLGMVHSVLFQQFHMKQPVPVDESIAPLLRCFLDGATPRP
ncbi:TetR/AcrR family transcriptional regulator [Archangium minus]|uniref:TetR/AcrR family transcriptional regulator n=2 Tax=Archangium minus TaxID=83450 RepID=A0ABY9WVX4_9BACT|nr:TetR/AcrR family transcriptional regulator [Archangium minus]